MHWTLVRFAMRPRFGERGGTVHELGARSAPRAGFQKEEGEQVHAFIPDFIQRLDGPLHFRFYVQPSMAILLAVRDGIRDARAGRSAFAWTMLVNPAQRRYLIADGWKAISKVFILACVLDVVYELIVWRSLRPVQMVLVGALLSVIPYVLLRGPVNRLVRLFSARRAPGGSPTANR